MGEGRPQASLRRHTALSQRLCGARTGGQAAFPSCHAGWLHLAHRGPSCCRFPLTGFEASPRPPRASFLGACRPPWPLRPCQCWCPSWTAHPRPLHPLLSVGPPTCGWDVGSVGVTVVVQSPHHRRIRKKWQRGIHSFTCSFAHSLVHSFIHAFFAFVLGSGQMCCLQGLPRQMKLSLCPGTDSNSNNNNNRSYTDHSLYAWQCCKPCLAVIQLIFVCDDSVRSML